MSSAADDKLEAARAEGCRAGLDDAAEAPTAEPVHPVPVGAGSDTCVVFARPGAQPLVPVFGAEPDATTTALPGAGPEPASETPWAAFRWADSDECQIDSVARGFRGVAKKMCEKDAAAVVYRVNNYPALHAHAVRLQAEVERLRGALPGGQE